MTMAQNNGNTPGLMAFMQSYMLNDQSVNVMIWNMVSQAHTICTRST